MLSIQRASRTLRTVDGAPERDCASSAAYGGFESRMGNDMRHLQHARRPTGAAYAAPGFVAESDLVLDSVAGLTGIFAHVAVVAHKSPSALKVAAGVEKYSPA
jgi:hypothetical protein